MKIGLPSVAALFFHVSSLSQAAILVKIAAAFFAGRLACASSWW